MSNASILSSIGVGKNWYMFEVDPSNTIMVNADNESDAKDLFRKYFPNSSSHIMTTGVNMMESFSMFELSMNTSKKIDDNRNLTTVLTKSMEELGELAQEILIKLGLHYKKPGVDGIIGEAVDVISCMFDLIYLTNPDIAEDEVKNILIKKLAKWEQKSNLMKEEKQK